MAKTALITGGTGAQGVAVTARRTLMALTVGMILGAGVTPAALSAASGARAAPVTAPLRCGGSGESGIFLYGGSFRALSQTTIAVCASGGVTVSFHSTPQGCSSGGPCGYTGTETWRATGGGVLILVAGRLGGHRVTDASLLLGFGTSVLETVTHTPATGRSSTCRDRNGQFAGFLSTRVRAGRLALGLGNGRPELIGPGQPPLLGTRCAGPFDGDLGTALPAASFALQAVRNGHVRLDLSGTHPFASRDFAGKVSADLVLSLGHARTGPPAGSVPGRGQRIRDVIDTYRVQRLRGQVSAGVTGSSDPGVCGRLDACGVRGTIHVATRAGSRGRLFVDATGPAHRPVRDFLTALGRGRGGDRSGISVNGGGEASVLGRVTAHLLTPGRCRDTDAVTTVALQLRVRGGRMQVALSGAGGLSGDLLRTRCPGPALGSRRLAVGSVPLTAFGRPTVTVTLRGARFAAGPYRVTDVGTFTLTLRRAGQSVHIYRFGP